MPRKNRAGDDADNDYTPFDGCLECRNPDPQARHRHYLTLARDCSLDEVERHLLDDLSRRLPDDLDRARSATRDIKVWLLGFMTQFAGMVDEETGRHLTWYEAMKLNERDMRETYDAIEDEGREKEAARGGWSKPSAPFTPITWDELTHRRAETMRKRRERREQRQR